MSSGLPDHLPPQSIDAEQAALGAALISPTAVERLLEILEREDFYLEAHRKIYDAIAYLAERDTRVDTLTLPEELRRRDQIDSVGGMAYVYTLAESVPTAAHVEYYARIVAEKSTLRKLIGAASEITAMAHEQEEEVNNIVDHAERLIFSVAQRRLNQGFVGIRPVVLDAMDRLEKVSASEGRLTGVTTGFHSLDTMTAGFQSGDLIIVAGRPSMGKTALCLAFGVKAASTEEAPPVAMFTLEMSKEQLAHRLICSEAKVDGMRLRTGFLRADGGEDDSDWIRVGRAVGSLGEMPIFIDDASDISVLEMRAKCRRLKSEHGLGMVIIDYLQLIRGHGKQENRNQEISVIARSLKGMARELSVPVIALSQLSRNVERREDKRPMLSDLRESGSIEAEADIVMMLYRSRYYERHDGDGSAAPAPGQEDLEETELIVAKHRNGPVGTVRMGFLRRYARFEDLAEGYEGPRD